MARKRRSQRRTRRPRRPKGANRTTRTKRTRRSKSLKRARRVRRGGGKQISERDREGVLNMMSRVAPANSTITGPNRVQKQPCDVVGCKYFKYLKNKQVSPFCLFHTCSSSECFNFRQSTEKYCDTCEEKQKTKKKEGLGIFDRSLYQGED